MKPKKIRLKESAGEGIHVEPKSSFHSVDHSVFFFLNTCFRQAEDGKKTRFKTLLFWSFVVKC